ncbi:MAG: hypothetical protein ABSE98_05295, partial [Acidimicrobiales bacterium]
TGVFFAGAFAGAFRAAACFFAGVFRAAACFFAGAFAVLAAFLGAPGGGVASGAVTKASYVCRRGL